MTGRAQGTPRRRRGLVAAALVAAAVVAAALLPVLPAGPDLYVHVLWTWQVMRCLAAGDLPVWLPDLNAGFGSPGIRLYSPLGPVLEGVLGLALGGAGAALRVAPVLAWAAFLLVGVRRRGTRPGSIEWAFLLVSPLALHSLLGRGAWSEYLAVPLLWWLLDAAVEGELRAGARRRAARRPLAAPRPDDVDDGVPAGRRGGRCDATSGSSGGSPRPAPWRPRSPPGTGCRSPPRCVSSTERRSPAGSSRPPATSSLRRRRTPSTRTSGSAGAPSRCSLAALAGRWWRAGSRAHGARRRLRLRSPRRWRPGCIGCRCRSTCCSSRGVGCCRRRSSRPPSRRAPRSTPGAGLPWPSRSCRWSPSPGRPWSTIRC